MIIVDRALQQRQREGRPINVAMAGAGFMARGVALQLLNVVPGMRLVAISNRHIDSARRLYLQAGATHVTTVATAEQLTTAIARGEYAVTDDAMLLCQADGVDAIIEATGTVDFGAQVVLEAIENGRHVVMLNVALDATVGPLLKAHADRAGVILTNMDGDQPAAIMNLYRFVKGTGIRPVLCGNIKGFQDHHRTPDGSVEFAGTWDQRAVKITSYTDGTDISFEHAIVANATNMRVARRGMHGPAVPKGTPIEEATNLFPMDDLLGGAGIVDYVLGAAPAPGVFVLGMHDHPVQQRYLEYYKMGAGPLYCFYTPYHLCHFEVPNTVARAVLFDDAAVTPLAGPVVEVITVAKSALTAGQTLDGIGGYLTYGQCENAEIARRENLLPMGISEGSRMVRAIAQDEALSLADVELPRDHLSVRLWAQQQAMFGTPKGV